MKIIATHIPTGKTSSLTDINFMMGNNPNLFKLAKMEAKALANRIFQEELGQREPFEESYFSTEAFKSEYRKRCDDLLTEIKVEIADMTYDDLFVENDENDILEFEIADN